MQRTFIAGSSLRLILKSASEPKSEHVLVYLAKAIWRKIRK